MDYVLFAAGYVGVALGLFWVADHCPRRWRDWTDRSKWK